MPESPDSYNGNSRVKRDGVEHSFTQEEIIEYSKCAMDVIYFTEKYIKIVSIDEGLVDFKLYDFQREMMQHFNDNRFSIAKLPRQAGKSVLSCAFLLHYAIFHPEKTVAILANKGAIAREMLARITLMLENLPFFLQPGCKTLNKGNIIFANNSEILAASTSSSSIRGLSINCLFLDEFAFVHNSEEFYTSTYPVISSGKNSKVIITSTPNGINNMFYKIWEAATKGESGFQPFEAKWSDVPGRDEEWKKATIANTSAEQFKQEFETAFVGTSNTLVDTNAILGIQSCNPIGVRYNVKIYEEAIEGHEYVALVDVSKGRGQDYSTINVIDISTTPFKQVAVYRDNMISPLMFPSIISRCGKLYNEALLIVENNDAGIVVCNALYYEEEYENFFVTSSVKSNGLGVTMSAKVKRIGCSNLKDLIEQGKLTIVDSQTIIELVAFGPRGSSYEGLNGEHDDLVMNLVLFAWYVSTDFFSEISDINLKELLYNDRIKEIEDDMMPFGFNQSSSEEDVWA